MIKIHYYNEKKTLLPNEKIPFPSCERFFLTPPAPLYLSEEILANIIRHKLLYLDQNYFYGCRKDEFKPLLKNNILNISSNIISEYVQDGVEQKYTGMPDIFYDKVFDKVFDEVFIDKNIENIKDTIHYTFKNIINKCGRNKTPLPTKKKIKNNVKNILSSCHPKIVNLRDDEFDAIFDDIYSYTWWNNLAREASVEEEPVEEPVKEPKKNYSYLVGGLLILLPVSIYITLSF